MNLLDDLTIPKHTTMYEMHWDVAAHTNTKEKQPIIIDISTLNGTARRRWRHSAQPTRRHLSINEIEPDRTSIVKGMVRIFSGFRNSQDQKSTSKIGHLLRKKEDLENVKVCVRGRARDTAIDRGCNVSCDGLQIS
jgi:hypothetical protein